MLLAYPLLLSSIGYALFSQDLAIDGITNKPAYSATPGMSLSYDTVQTPAGGGVIIYNITATVKNIGAGSVARWQVKFDLPAGFTQFSCASTVTCTTSGTTVTVNSGTTNSTIAAGATRQFTFTFRSTVQNYQLQNLYVIGVESTFQTISGLTVSATRTAGGILSLSHTYRFTVTNNSGQSVRQWRVTAGGWGNGNNVTSMDSRIHWIDLSNSLILIDTDPLANGTNIVFSGQFSSGLLWSLGSVNVVGIH